MMRRKPNRGRAARTRPNYKSAITDPVQQLAQMSALVLTALDRIEEGQAAAEKDGNVALVGELQLRRAELEDRRKALEQEASFLSARSATGALFQTMVASNELHALGESTLGECDRRATERRIQRCLFSVVRFLSTMSAAKMERVKQYYAPGYLDPLAAAADAITQAEATVAARPNAQGDFSIFTENSALDGTCP